ncbi:MAG: dephospho-CoA kinase [Lachnospiraceae bacterium]|nr:dephospho-CoA kinase [Lachnospiraceae bacterium]
MKVIGITGGVGAGKSTVLGLIKNEINCYILIADEAAHEVEKKGEKCYFELIDLLGEDILAPDGAIDKKRMADRIFSQDGGELLSRVNRIVHPRVKEYILKLIDEKRRSGSVDFFFIEAALLIEDGYKEICDELWYIYAEEEIRAARLKASRAYSDEKIRSIMKKQNDDETFRKYCDHIIENNGDTAKTREQIMRLLGDRKGE